MHLKILARPHTEFTFREDDLLVYTCTEDEEEPAVPVVRAQDNIPLSKEEIESHRVEVDGKKLEEIKMKRKICIERNILTVTKRGSRKAKK